MSFALLPEDDAFGPFFSVHADMPAAAIKSPLGKCNAGSSPAVIEHQNQPVDATFRFSKRTARSTLCNLQTPCLQLESSKGSLSLCFEASQVETLPFFVDAGSICP